ncbi:MAG: tRNA (5-methylaminomethyl-2-thiouridine)(34)-methyltransferase MnmD [Rikenellaceae bacterium]
MEFYKGEIIDTDDGSKSVKHHLFQDTYHSVSGALQESLYVYIESGLKFIDRKEIKVFEMGFGTGLNMLLTIDYALENDVQIDYHTVELFPLALEVIENMGFEKFCTKQCYEVFLEAHKLAWNNEKPVFLHKNFSLTKYKVDIIDFSAFPDGIDVVYYDAFSPDTQPDLWSEQIFTKLYAAMSEDSVFMTYSSKGDVKRALRNSGFEVKRLPGPANKRHIVRALKNAI